MRMKTTTVKANGPIIARDRANNSFGLPLLFFDLLPAITIF